MPSWSAILLHPVWPSFPVRKRPLWAKRLEGSRTLLLPPLLHVDHPPPCLVKVAPDLHPAKPGFGRDFFNQGPAFSLDWLNEQLSHLLAPLVKLTLPSSCSPCRVTGHSPGTRR